MKKLILALLIAMAAPAAADDVLVYANHYCKPGFARIDFDPDWKGGVTITTASGKVERSKRVIEYPDIVLVSKKGKRERIQFYYGTNYTDAVIFRDEVLWPVNGAFNACD